MNPPEIVVAARALVGEAPVWDERAGTLIWVDILRCEIHRFDPADASDTFVRLPDTVSAARPSVDGPLAVAVGLRAGVFDEASGRLDLRGGADIGGRTNDATCDPMGRFWVGTMSIDRPGGALYRLDGDTLTTVLPDVGLSNGLAWTAHGDTAYFADTTAEQVYAFDADPAAGTLTNRRVFIDLTDDDGRPDGLALDEDGGVWLATAGGGQVRRYDAAGSLDEVIDFGMSGVTSCGFGGPNLDDLYVTTMCLGMSETELHDHPAAGALLRVPGIGVRGLPVTLFAG